MSTLISLRNSIMATTLPLVGLCLVIILCPVLLAAGLIYQKGVMHGLSRLRTKLLSKTEQELRDEMHADLMKFGDYLDKLKK